MSADEKYIECCEHGKQQSTYVCQHIIETLNDGKPRGFWWADDPDNPRPDAWCSKCEAKVQETNGEWDDESKKYAGVKLLCGACYDRAKEINFGKNKKWWQGWK